VHDRIDAIGLHPGPQTHGVDLIRKGRLGAPFPARDGRRCQPVLPLRVVPPVHPDLSRGQVAGLAELPSDVVALAAVPDLGARPMRTSPSLPDATRLLVVPIPHRGIIDPSHATRPR
jgi:hypothetical protein